ncbi:PP0621 family protein [Noviherbaspirillum aerium]|uniref:PP0621 family protein n=1 Tax=Noviherbaspirillum aerium TaxID=2588497 RepID=UPI00124D1C96|nr:PP0621 family protein [Noviherbaspirillum aerium]
MKLLIWVLLAALIVFWVFLSRKKQKAKASRKRPRESAGRTGTGDAEIMIPCTQCGIHLPYSEAVIGAAGAPFCSEAHRLQHDRR